MITFAPTLARLRRPVIAGALAILAGGALVLWSQAERDHAEAALRQHSARLTQARAALQSAREIDAAARHGLQQIQTLRGTGLLDAPDRQAWHHHLLGLQRKLGPGRLEWELSPFKPTSAEDTASALRHTTLHLQGEVAHEGRLLALLERPGGVSNGLFLPRRCRLLRIQPEPDAPGTPGLALDCEIDWIFLPLPEIP